jgi:hypothetical protein
MEKNKSISNLIKSHYYRSLKFRLIPDGRIYTLHISEGSKGIFTEGKLNDGDLQFSFNRASIRSYSNWQVKIKTMNGGLIESSDKYMYLAPKSGYKDTWVTDITSYKYSLNKKFYVHLVEKNIYGELNIEFRPFRGDDAALYIKYTLNPNGGRILE